MLSCASAADIHVLFPPCDACISRCGCVQLSACGVSFPADDVSFSTPLVTTRKQLQQEAAAHAHRAPSSAPARRSKRWQLEMAAGVAPPGWRPAEQTPEPPDTGAGWWLRLSLLGVGGAGALCCVAALRMSALTEDDSMEMKAAVDAGSKDGGCEASVALREQQMAAMPARYS